MRCEVCEYVGEWEDLSMKREKKRGRERGAGIYVV